MKLSIIIPVYNVEAYLLECLDSVYNQSLEDCEVIAVNDGATDSSRQLLATYQLHHPELIIIDQENKGLSGARNTGMKHAKGDYLYFLDSDDYMLPNAIKTIKEAIQTSNAEVIGFNATKNATSLYIPSFNVDNVNKTGIDYFVDFYKMNGNYPSINVPVYVYESLFLNNINIIFKEGLYHEDILFSIFVLYKANKVNAFNFPIFNYRQNREGSITTNVKLKNIIDRSSICRELNDFFEANKNQSIYFYNLLFHQYLFNNIQAIENGCAQDRKLYFNKKDKAIMKKGIMNIYELKLWILACIDLKILAYYYSEKSTFIKRLINIGFSLLKIKI